MKKLFVLTLALCMTLALSVNSFAAEIGESGGSGTTPVTLTTTNNGLDGGDGEGGVTPTKLSVTVPTALPMAMSDDGNVVTATDCKIVNLSYGAVRVKTVTISAASGWHLTAFGNKSTLASEKVDANNGRFQKSITTIFERRPGHGKRSARPSRSLLPAILLWHFSLPRSTSSRLSSSPWVRAWASGGPSTSWRATATTTPAQMLMYGKEAQQTKLIRTAAHAIPSKAKMIESRCRGQIVRASFIRHELRIID